MTVQTLKLGRERFVLLREKDYELLKAQAKAGPTFKTPRLNAQDRQDIALAKRRQSEKTGPYAQLRKELCLA